ncbi:fungal specific transcription factor domain-containing protein [Sarocladium implicatum]|nr:fungal specific transcription factor domain-containing protein [Sarocladium implicatum]
MSDAEEERSRKRHRVSRACDTCRRRKERCDGDQPSCQRCIAASRTCYYNPTKKRGLRPGYVRTLEILLGLFLRAFDGAEDLLVSVLNQRLDGSRPPNRERQQGRNALDVASLLEVWRKSAVLEDLQNMLNSGDAVEDEELYIQNLDTKLTSVFNSIARSKGSNSLPWGAESQDMTLQPYYTEPERVTRAATGSHQLNPTHVERPLPTTVEVANPSAMKLPKNWSQLIDTYVTDTSSWLPIIQKYTLFRTASLSARAENDSSSASPPMGEVTLLWAVFAYSSYRQRRTGVRASHDADSHDETTCQHIMAQARSLALQDQSSYDLGNIHASLTFGLLEMQRESWSSAWLWVGRAVYIASTIGVIPEDWDQPISDEVRRCFLGCFILDTLVATKLGQRPYLRRADLSRVKGLSDDGPEEWESLRPSPGQVLATASAGSFGPGRVLSTFNDLCYMVAAIGQYSDDLTHPRPELSDFISHLARRDNLATLSEPQSLDSLISDPPHILQAKLAAAAAYSRLQGTLQMVPVGSGSTSLYNSVQRGVIQILGLVKTADRSVFTGLWLPPTTHILIQILQEGRAQMRLPSQGINNMSTAVGHGAQPGRLAEETRAVPGSTELSPDKRRSSAMGSGPRAIGNVQDPLAFQDSVDHTLLRKTTQRPQEPLGGFPHQAVNSAMVDPGISRFVPVLTPPLSTQPDDLQTHAPILEAHDHQPVVRPTDDGASDGLFNQLISLDSSEWPTLSEEFMQHLGLARDGSLIEFQNLLASHDMQRDGQG